MKKILVLLTALAALAVFTPPDPADSQTRMYPYWREVQVNWISSRSDGSARAYTTSSSAPVQHSNGVAGFATSLLDTSAAIDISDAWVLIGKLGRGMDTDTSDVYPLFKFSLNHDPTNGIDTTWVVVQGSRDGLVWSSFDSLGHNPVRATADWAQGLAAPGPNYVVSADSIRMSSLVFSQLPYGQDMLVVGEPLLGTLSRSVLGGAKFMRFICSRDKSTFSSSSGTSRSYSIGLSVFAAPR